MADPNGDRRRESGVPVAAIFFGVAAAHRLAEAGESRPLEAIEKAEQMRLSGASERAIYAETNKMLAGTEYAGVSYDAAGEPRFEVSDAKAKLNYRALKRGEMTTLGTILPHPESERVLPGRDQTMVIHDSRTRGIGTTGDDIRIGDKYVSRTGWGGATLTSATREALLHEEQHMAQIDESRPGGGKPEDFARDQKVTYRGKTGTLKGSSDEVAQYNRYKTLAGEQEAELTRARADMTAEQRRQVHPDDMPYRGRVPRSEQIIAYDAEMQAMADIDDFGEKIGGARKDRAVKTGPKPKSAEPADTRPGWMKRYVAAEQLRGGQPTGQWTLLDTRKKNRYTGGAAQATRTTFASQAEAERAIPMLAVSQKHYVRENYGKTPEGKYDTSKSTWEVWRKVSDKKTVKAVAETFPTREAAMRYMAENAPTLLGTAKGYGEEILAKPEKVVRTGPNWRKGDVDPSAFAKEIGYRGVEFGNWQGERGQHLNMAYDAMRDLADITGVRPESLTLQQRLALAFGARGHGGKGAARAHYEPQRAAINLTREGGAGTLAHEWWHAADHYLAQLDDPKLGEMKVAPDGTKVLPHEGRENIYASQRVDAKRPGQLNEAVRQAYKELMETMLRKPEQVTVDVARHERSLANARTNLENQIKSLRDDLAQQRTYGQRNTAPASAAQLAKFDEIAAKLMKGEGLDVEWKFAGDPNARLGARGSMTYRWQGEALDALSNLYKEVRGRSGFDNQHRHGPMDALAQQMRSVKSAMTQVEQAKASPTATVMTMTDFVRNARKLDDARTTPYWQTRHELAARAFEAYIQDKMAAAGRRSDYLSWGADNALYSIFEEAKPYPEGAERAAINAKFDKLFDAMKQAEVVAPATPVAPAALAASDDIAKAMQGAKGQQGWTDEARIASADARDVARPGEAKPVKTGYKPTDKWTDAEKYVDHPNGERTIAKSWIRAYEAEIRGLPDTDPTKPLRMEHAQILAGTRWRADGTAYSPALLEAAKAEVKAQQDAAFGQSKRGQRARKDQQAREATVGDNGGPSDAAIKTAEKLEAVARRTIEASQKEVNAPRLMNTARRARMGSGVIEQHQQNIADARTALKIAEALRNGEAGALANVKSLADATKEGKKTVHRTWLAPTDLKDYVAQPKGSGKIGIPSGYEPAGERAGYKLYGMTTNPLTGKTLPEPIMMAVGPDGKIEHFPHDPMPSGMRSSERLAEFLSSKDGKGKIGFQNPDTLNAALKAQGKAEAGKAEAPTLSRADKAKITRMAKKAAAGGEDAIHRAKLAASANADTPARKAQAAYFSKALDRLSKVNSKLGTIAMIGAPVAAAAVAYDATRSQAMAEGASSTTANAKAGMAAAAAGGTTAAVVYGAGKVIGAGLGLMSKVAPAAAGPVGWAVIGGLTAYGAYRAYQNHKESGLGGTAAVLSLAGLDEALHLAKPRNTSAGPTRLTTEQAHSFKAANEAHAAMKANESTNTLKGFQNPANLASAMAAQGKTWDGAYGKKD